MVLLVGVDVVVVAAAVAALAPRGVGVIVWLGLLFAEGDRLRSSDLVNEQRQRERVLRGKIK
jgi:hypothetical protein